MSSQSSIHTIAFYNVENLFDFYVDNKTNDNDFVPISAKNWTQKRYERKTNQIGFVISKIGFETAQKPPTLVGLAEIENDLVLKDLIESKELRDFNYAFVHFNSLDERGIDVALLYNKDNFRVETSQPIPIHIADELGKTDFTRDILLVSGYLDNEKIYILINHWPSRNEGSEETEYKRMIASVKLIEIISTITKQDASSRIIVLGDFNDNPTSKSMLNLKQECTLYNPTESVWSYSRGSVNHNFSWMLFDQILLSPNFLEESDSPLTLEKVDIYDEKFLTQYDGKFKGQPFRTYVGKKYKGGFSDHFPVYIQVKKHDKTWKNKPLSVHR